MAIDLLPVYAVADERIWKPYRFRQPAQTGALIYLRTAYVSNREDLIYFNEHISTPA
jgi:hypothetical protein